MFTDIVGFTAMMQEDERKAKEQVNRHRNVLEQYVLEHQGRILQHYGDGTLSIFGSAIEGVKCAVKVQQELQKNPKVPLRIGMHIGDIVYDNEGVYGDGVNIASRIQTLSVPGGVLISEKVYDEIRNQPELRSVHLGEFELKNVKRPVGVYAMHGEGLVIPKTEEMRGKTEHSHNSIAVLPFVNMSSDLDNEYFSDGVTEEIINALTKVEGLQVTSRTSSFAFKGKNLDIREIGTKLNVSTVLEGSVRKAGDRIRITAQLIDVSSGYHFWSDIYNRKLEDIFELQDEIAKKIVEQLREKLEVGRATQPLVKSPTENLDAYNLYLRGLFYWNKWTPGSVKKAIGYFEEAIEKEPRFARAYSWMANCYIYLAAMGFAQNEVAYPKAKGFALKALEYDSKLAEAYISIALTKFFLEWDWEGAYQNFQKALELSPGLAGVHFTYAMYLTVMGNFDEAISEAEQAVRLDPLSPIINSMLGQVYMNAGRYDDAIKEFDRALELDPYFRTAIDGKGWTCVFKGRVDEGIKLFKRIQELTGKDYAALGELGYAYSVIGEIEKTKECLERLKQRAGSDPHLNLEFDFAVLYASLKDYDKVFYYLDRAVEKRIGGVVFIKVSPGWEPFHNDPRFKKLLEKIGFKE